MGLASVYGIIKNHGGAINAQSELGHGTTFKIYLPITTKPAIQECILKTDVTKGSGTVLLVDDEDMIIDVGQALLKHLGYRVFTEKSGEAALATVRRIGADIDLVILDIIMPGMDGSLTFDRIRKIDPAIPVMLASGYASDDRVKKIISRGCNGFIQKPFTLSELSKKVRSVIGNSPT